MFLAPLLLAAAGPWRLELCGDIMLNGISARRSPFTGITALMHRADLVFANLEAPMTSIGSPTPRKTRAELKSRTQFVLRANPGHVRWLAQAGISAVSLGNNHAMDFGTRALARELATLDRAGIRHAGAGINEVAASSVVVIVLPTGLRVGLLSGLAFVGARALSKCTPATRHTPGVNALYLSGRPTAARLQKWVRAAHRRCDVLVVGVHGGIERHAFPTAYQVTLAHALIDAGADVVWGHHPHVLEGAELYKGHPILYSMGNLVSPTSAVGGLISLTFSGTEFKRAGFVPIRVEGGRVFAEKVALQADHAAAFVRLCAQTAAKVHVRALPVAAE